MFALVLSCVRIHLLLPLCMTPLRCVFDSNVPLMPLGNMYSADVNIVPYGLISILDQIDPFGS